MELLVPYGSETKTVRLSLPANQVIVAQSRHPRSARSFDDVVAEAIRSPVGGVAAVHEQSLCGRRVVVITDDWARPTPAYQVIPLILEQLAAAGAQDDAITFVTASGMHDPLSRDELARKLGPEIVARYRCISHDGGDHAHLAFCGISRQGTPIWINRYVAEADCRVALGRIYLHEAYGYEGGYKMILPGVSSYETIVRHHSQNFSPDCCEGNHDNPSRREADAVGRMVGLHFLINVVVNSFGEPIRAFCGEPMEVHRQGVAFGEAEVWGAEVEREADIVLVSPGSGPPPAGYDPVALHRGARVAREGGYVIGLTSRDVEFDEPEGTAAAGEALFELPLDRFGEALRVLSLSELIRVHEKRDWQLSPRHVQWRIKSVRGEFYRRRRLQDIKRRRVALTSDPEAALRRAVADVGSGALLAVLPEARTTLARVSCRRSAAISV